MPDHDCVYASATWGIHDERWTQALRDLGHAPAVAVLGRDAPANALREHVVNLAQGSLPVLAGPLTTIARLLVRSPVADDQPLDVVGLSWGFDLFELQRHHDLGWLTGLRGLIVDSEPTRAIALAAGVPAEAVTFLPWGIDLVAFTPDGPRLDLASLGIAPGTRMVLSLRAHEPLYRVQDIVAGFAEVATHDPTVVLVVGHTGSLTPELEAQASSLGIQDRVRFIGGLPEAELPALLRAAACYVSASEVDGTSVTLLQAMACGVPVVASETPGNERWVQDGSTGTTFTTGSPASLASALSIALLHESTSTTDAARTQVLREADWSRNIARLDAALFG